MKEDILQFVYTPLISHSSRPVIRVVELEEGSGDIHLRMQQIRLERQSNYMALSYVWGNTNTAVKAFCNGKQVTLTLNLYGALRQLRSTAGNKRFWIDALCIDQENQVEKMQQIQLMDQVYACAQNVIVWLGEGIDHPGNTELAFRHAHVLSLTKDLGKNSSNARVTAAPFDRAWQSFDGLFTLPWWSRIWIIQEVFMNKHDILVQCGKHRITWSELHNAVGRSVCRDQGPVYSPLFDGRAAFQLNRKYDIASLAMLHQDCGATNPIDKIFALCSLAEPKVIPSEFGTYRDPFAKICTKWAISCMDRCLNLDALGGVNRDTRFTVETTQLMVDECVLPSWVADLSQPRSSYSLSYHTIFSSSPRRFEVSIQPPHHVQRSVVEHLLPVRGHIFATIASIGLKAEDTCTSEKATKFPLVAEATNRWINDASTKLLWQLSWEQISQVRQGHPYVTGESIEDAYWQILSAGDSSNDSKQEFQDFDKDMKSLRWIHSLRASSLRRLVHFLVLSLFLRRYILPVPKTKGWPFVERMLFAKGRRLARLKNGYLGLVPGGAQIGDQIWFLQGGKVPFVLRKIDLSRESPCTLIGEAYIHGVMQGERFEEECLEEIFLG